MVGVHNAASQSAATEDAEISAAGSGYRKRGFSGQLENRGEILYANSQAGGSSIIFWAAMTDPE